MGWINVPKQITLSDRCFGFKLVHNFHKSDALPAVKPPFRPWGNCSALWLPQQRIWLKSKNHYHDETKEQRERTPEIFSLRSLTIYYNRLLRYA